MIFCELNDNRLEFYRVLRRFFISNSTLNTENIFKRRNLISLYFTINPVDTFNVEKYNSTHNYLRTCIKKINRRFTQLGRWFGPRSITLMGNPITVT